MVSEPVSPGGAEADVPSGADRVAGSAAPSGLPEPAPSDGRDDGTSDRVLAPATLAVAIGRPAREPGEPVNVPPVLTSTYAAGGEVEYSRHGNPTWSALEDAIAALEGPGALAVTFASGMAATAAVLEQAAVGATVVIPRVAYNGTLGLLDRWAEAGRLQLIRTDAQPEAIARAAARAPQLPATSGPGVVVWIETPSNPMLDVIDIREVAAALPVSALLVVDSTFATPLGQRPLDLGAHVVVHSATKYLSGHSDVLLGACLTRDPRMRDGLQAARTLVGGIPGTMEAWLALRGLRTFPLRWERSCANASELARRCAAHPAVTSVRHLGLPGDVGHELAERQMESFGAIVTITVRGGAQGADRAVAGARLWLNATSLGGVESSLERRRRWPQESTDVPDDLIRLSVGIEDVEDLWADLSQALDRA